MWRKYVLDTLSCFKASESPKEQKCQNCTLIIVSHKLHNHTGIPFHMREKVEAELQRLQQFVITEDVKGPTQWVSPIVAQHKPGNPEQIRTSMCTRHITPTLEELLSDLNGATMFSKLDLKKGYQCELDESSLYITTFSTHLWLNKYKWLSFWNIIISRTISKYDRADFDWITKC